MEDKQKWNEKYEEKLKEVRMPVPNDRLALLASYLKGGAALDLACGLGGNSLYLARLGYRVSAIDLSDTAIQYVQEQAKSYMLPIHAEVFDLTEYESLPFDEDSFELAVITNYLDRSLFPYVKSWVKKGGFVFIETFFNSPELQSQRMSKKFCLSSNELLEEFKGWKVLSFEENEHEGRQMIFCQK
ncbi:hypothetical protein AM500_16970 [Bacillus sp. FJAT-18017]|uniref:class I SAM-dependent methyltransferase n=1 Tax=Bacillus sp. FJAT-18017 TaxID=1705566 RepID=UPI0006AF71DD|nr:methyltransferase domain-containing protein [Bacillus sp. FJAT-18017]ALC91298.1 hypothetical protein AM500_16970 [Bacillus sp. FJAT-18017]